MISPTALLLVFGLSCGCSFVMGQAANPLADTIWKGTCSGKIKKLVRYVDGKKEWQTTGATVEQFPFEIWFPSASTFCVIYVNNPPSFMRNGQELAGKYQWLIGALPCDAANPRDGTLTEGTVDSRKRRLLAKGGSERRFPAWDGIVEARYAYKKSGKTETLNLTGVVQVLYQRMAPDGRVYRLEPEPVTVPFSGTFTKTSRMVSEEILKTGAHGFGERGMRGGL